jgi:protein-disulfide isomerase
LVAGLLGYFVPAGMSVPAVNPPVVVAPTPTPTPTPTPQPVAATSIALSELEGFLETAYVSGNKDAKVSVIEFSDVECPFCIRHVNNGTLDQVNEKYGDDVNVIYAHFPLSFHPLAQKAGEAIECAGDLGGEEVFFSYKKALFAKGGKPTLDVIETVATEQELDAVAFMECVNGGEFAQKVQDQMAFGRKL